MNLTAQQQFAATYSQGPLMIVAGPGTGKTHTLAHRVKWLIEEKKTALEKILVLTFTCKAAEEMEKRLGNNLRFGNNLPFVGTIHGLCAKILCHEYSELKIVAEKKTSDQITSDQITFDELLTKTLALLQKNGQTLKFWRDQFEYILVDEYQDIDNFQYEIIKLLGQRNITVIGDPDQVIYSFRGANLKNFLAFEKDYPGAKLVHLEQNFRSTKKIVALSNELIRNNTERLQKNLHTKNIEGEKILLSETENASKEGYFIIREIEKLMGGTSHYQFYKGHVDTSLETKDLHFGDFAVLYRLHQQAKALKSCFQKAGIPVQIIGGKNIFENKKTQELLKILEGIIEAKTVSDTIRKLLTPEDLESEEITSFLTFSMQFDNLPFKEALTKLLEKARFGRAEDLFNPDANAVTLMTAHAAKGLEFKVVFITGIEEGIFPYSRNENLEEERRLFYVAITRAQERLYITHARERLIFGKTVEQKPSRFLSELPDQYIEKKTFWKRKKTQKFQRALF